MMMPMMMPMMPIMPPMMPMMPTPMMPTPMMPMISTTLMMNIDQVNLISSIGDNGLYLCSLPLAYTLDKTSPAVVAGLASLLGAAGYTLMALVNASILPVSPFLMGLGFFLVGLASSGGYSSALATNVVNFSPDARGTIVGIIVGGFGISAFVFAQIYNGGYGPNKVTEFFVLLACCLGFVFAAGVVLLRKLVYVPKEPVGDDAYIANTTNAAAGGSDVESVSSSQHYGEHAQSAGKDYGSVNKPLLAASGSSGAQQAVEVVGHSGGDEVPEVVGELHGWGLATSLDYWLLYFTLVAGLGCGLMYINNLSSILVSINEGHLSKSALSSRTSLLVGALSIANCIGRVAFGSSSDAVVPRVGIPHASFLCLAMSMMVVAQALNAFVFLSLESVWATTIVTGLAYGGLFAIGPTCVSRFSLKFFATNWSITSTAAGVGGNILNTIYGVIYDDHQPSGSDKCFGHACYQSSFYISFAVAAAGLFSAAILTHRRSRAPPPVIPTRPLLH